MSMMRSSAVRKALGALLVAPFIFALTTAADAADDKAISLKAGINYLAEKSARDAAGDTGIHLGAGYALPTGSLLAPGQGVGSVDLTYNRNKSGDDKVEVWGLSYNERIRSYDAGGPSAFYYGLGVGLFNVDVSRTAGSQDKTKIGFNALLGYDLSETTFIEAGYSLMGKVNGLRGDSIVVSIGVRM